MHDWTLHTSQNYLVSVRADPGTCGTRERVAFLAVCVIVFPLVQLETYGNKDYRSNFLAMHVFYIRPSDIFNNVVGEKLKILLL